MSLLGPPEFMNDLDTIHRNNDRVVVKQLVGAGTPIVWDRKYKTVRAAGRQEPVLSRTFPNRAAAARYLKPLGAQIAVV